MHDADHIHAPDCAAGGENAFSLNRRETEAASARPLGRVVAVSGSQVVAEFPMGECDVEVTVGSLVGIQNNASLAVGTLCDISAGDSAGDRSGVRAVGRIDLLGEIAGASSSETRFQSGLAAYPKIGCAVVALAGADLRAIFGLSDPSVIEIGRLQQNESIAATINVEEMVRRHFAIVGSTGSGKSSAVALILRKIIQERGDLRMLVIDAHNEYAECFEDRAHVLGPDNLRLPFWLFDSTRSPASSSVRARMPSTSSACWPN